MEWLGPIASVLGGAGQFAGGLKGLFGGGGGYQMMSMSPQNMFSSQTLLDLNERDFQWQKLLATDGIQMRVNDARKAGLHPLFALGGGQAGFTPPPLSVGMGSPSEAIPGGGDNIGASLQNMGQGLQRALMATQTKEQRQLDAYETMVRNQTLTRNDLQNQLLASQIARLQADQVGPPMASTPNSGAFKINPNEITASQPDARHITAGPPHPSAEFSKMGGGHQMALPAKPLQIDDMGSPGWVPWLYRNQVLPFVKQALGHPTDQHQPAERPRPGYQWHFAFPGTWKQVPISIPDYDRGGHYGRSSYRGMGVSP